MKFSLRKGFSNLEDEGSVQIEMLPMKFRLRNVDEKLMPSSGRKYSFE